MTFFGFNKKIACFATSTNVSLIPGKSYFKINNTVLRHLINIGRIGEFCTDIGLIEPCIQLILNKVTAPNMSYLHMQVSNTSEVQLKQFKFMLTNMNDFANKTEWNGDEDLYMLEIGNRPITQKWLSIIKEI